MVQYQGLYTGKNYSTYVLPRYIANEIIKLISKNDQLKIKAIWKVKKLKK